MKFKCRDKTEHALNTKSIIQKQICPTYRRHFSDVKFMLNSINLLNSLIFSSKD